MWPHLYSEAETGFHNLERLKCVCLNIWCMNVCITHATRHDNRVKLDPDKLNYSQISLHHWGPTGRKSTCLGIHQSRESGVNAWENTSSQYGDHFILKLQKACSQTHKAISKHRLVIVDSMICIYMLLYTTFAQKNLRNVKLHWHHRTLQS